MLPKSPRQMKFTGLSNEWQSNAYFSLEEWHPVGFWRTSELRRVRATGDREEGALSCFFGHVFMGILPEGEPSEVFSNFTGTGVHI